MMKLSLIVVFTFLVISRAVAGDALSSPLSQFSKEWDDSKYSACNTAAHVKYMSDTEKQVIYILNLIRVNPKLFRRTVLSQSPEIDQTIDTGDDEYFGSLVKKLDTMLPLRPLMPDSLCWVSARCHVLTSGPMGVVTHERQTTECEEKHHAGGECCTYGYYDPLKMIVALLIDKNSMLGHRHVCFDRFSEHMSVAMGQHSKYGIMAVLDFW
jgi:hypothetical protein